MCASFSFREKERERMFSRARGGGRLFFAAARASACCAREEKVLRLKVP